MRPCVVRRAVPDADHVLAGAPFVILGETEPNNGPALRPDEVLARDADGLDETGGLCDDLIERARILAGRSAGSPPSRRDARTASYRTGCPQL